MDNSLIGGFGGDGMNADGKPDLGGFEPFNDAHAIYSCSIAIQFSSAIEEGSDAWLRLLERAHATGRDLNLGVPAPSYGMIITFDTQHVTVNLGRPLPFSDEAMGVEFALMNEKGRPVERFLAARDSILVQTYSYIRWDPFFARAKQFMNHMFEAYERRTVASAKVEYWDRFEHRDLSRVADASKLFQRNSPYIATGVFDSISSWHSHFGRIQSVDDRYRRLVNARVDVVEPPQTGRLVTIYTMTQDGVAKSHDEDPSLRSLDAIFASFESQHSALKEILSDIISPDASRRISLEA